LIYGRLTNLSQKTTMKNMFFNLIHDYAIFQTWKKISDSYATVRPPARVSPIDVLNYYTLLSYVKIDPMHILILGATPELRRLAYDFSAKPIAADFSLAMMGATNPLLIPEIIKKEKRLLVNWFQLDWFIEPQSLHGIVGDLVFRQIAAPRHEEFIARVSRLLVPGGFAIFRVNHLNPNWYKRSSEEIILDALRKHQDGIDGAYSTLLFRLCDKFSEPPNYEVNREPFFKCFIDAFHKASGREKKEIQKLSAGLGKYFAPWSHTPKENFEKIINRYFETIRVITADDYFDSQFFPTYLLRKK
jgi:hypothetical protein